MVTLLAMGILSGCIGKSGEKDKNESLNVESPVAAEPAEAEHTVYPLTVEDSFGNTVIFEEKPERIVSVAPSITETVFALGAEGLLVGRTDYCDYPAEVSGIESVGTLKEPNIEKIVELDTDLVIASTHFSDDVYEKLNELGIKVIVLNPNDSFEGVFSVIEVLGDIVDQSANADKLNSDMKETIEEVKAKVSGLPAPSVYYVVGYGEFGDFTAGGGTFISEMIRLANGKNIADDVEGWGYSLEKVVEHDPEMIIVSRYYETKAGLIAANGYKDLSAVKAGDVFEIDNNMIDRQGPRIAQGFKALAEIIHPDAFK